MKFSAIGGVVGPMVFVGGWLVLGFLQPGYSPVSDAISELARVDTRTSNAMTIVFGIYSLGILALSSALNSAGRTVAVVHALATAAVAAFPLGGADTAHFVAATLAYVTLAALPIAVRRTRTNIAVSTVIALTLIASVIAPDDLDGLVQRAGLTVGDVWITVASLLLIATISRDYEGENIAAGTNKSLPKRFRDG
jgi:hypothetical membrane protein